MSCEDHTDEKLIAFCEKCDALVCCECIIDTHQNHTFQKLSKIVKEKLEQILNEFVPEKEIILNNLLERFEELEISKREGSDKEDNIIKEIYDRAEEIKTHVDYTRDKQVSKVRALFQSQRNLLEQKVTSINEATEKLTNLSDDENSLQSKSDLEIIQLHTCINTQLEEIWNQKSASRIEGKFVSGGEFEENLEKLFGSFENESETLSDGMDLPSSVDKKSRKLQIVDLDLNGKLKSLHLTGEDSGWLLSVSGYLYFANSISKKEYKERVKDVTSFAVSQEGEIFITTNSSVVKKINTDDRVTRWCDMSPYLPIQVFIRKPGEISALLASKEDNSVYLWRFDSMGRKLETGIVRKYAGDVRKIAENGSGEICVRRGYGNIDLYTEVPPNFKATCFRGVFGAVPSKNHFITDFCYVSKNRIVALDSKNDVIYLLDRECAFIKCLTSIEEIKSPEYVSLDSFERLWIGTSSGTYILSNWDQ